MSDDMGRHIEHRLPGERIFLAKPFRIGQLDELPDLGPELVTVMDRSRHNRPAAPLHGPPAAAVHSINPIHRAE